MFCEPCRLAGHWGAVALLLATAASLAQGVVARVGDSEVTQGEVDVEIGVRSKSPDAATALAAQTTAGRAEAACAVTERRALSLKARAQGLAGAAQVAARLRWATDRVLAEEFIDREFQRPYPDEQALRRFHAQHPGLFSIPERVKARHIVVRTETDARRMLDLLTDGADFAKLAKLHSDDAKP